MDVGPLISKHALNFNDNEVDILIKYILNLYHIIFLCLLCRKKVEKSLF